MSSGLGGCRGLFLVIVGIILIICSIAAGYKDLRYSAQGKLTTATVTYSWQERYRSRTSTYCYYKFTVAGRQYDGKDGDHQPDEQLQIQYLATDPHENRIAGHGYWMPEGLIALIIGVAAIVVGSFMMRKEDDLMTD